MARTKSIVITLALIAVAAITWIALRQPSPSATPATVTPAGAPALARGGSLVASVRSEPASYNRYAAAGISAATDFLTLLTQSRLVRVNRATDDLEPWLAE